MIGRNLPVNTFDFASAVVLQFGGTGSHLRLSICLDKFLLEAVFCRFQNAVRLNFAGCWKKINIQIR